MGESARVWVVLLFGDQAEIAADAPDAEPPVQYPAAEVAAAVGVPAGELPGMRLWADVDGSGRLGGWRRRS